MTPTKPDCPTCSAAHERYRERGAAADGAWERARAAAAAERHRAWAAANAELDRVLDAHPNHAQETDQ